MNALKTGILMVVMGGIFLAVGYLFKGMGGAIVMLGVSLAFNFGMYWFSETIALKFAKAQELQPGQMPWLEQANRDLSQRAGIPPARLHISPDPQPNAFACGRGPGHASICINEGLIQAMPEDQVVGVLAHEIAHIANRDVLTMTVVASMASAVMFISRFAFFFGGDDDAPNPIAMIAIMILGPLAAILVQMAVSRQREYAADEMGARLVGDPRPLANALQNLHSFGDRVPSMTAAPQTAHMYISNPLRGGGLMSLFSTHPPVEERVRRLMSLQGRAASA
ncbi:MAG: M48 family metalloprotease [Armatimonadota bacterium]|nr:M48 family metalloprotease [Armatimonadota bacterium]